MSTDLPTRGTAHHNNYLRYKAQQDALPQPFTASQQRTPLQYLPYAHYPETPGVETPTPTPDN